jgi:RNA polymerase sigma factor (sigma-70 family)
MTITGRWGRFASSRGWRAIRATACRHRLGDMGRYASYRHRCVRKVDGGLLPSGRGPLTLELFDKRAASGAQYACPVRRLVTRPGPFAMSIPPSMQPDLETLMFRVGMRDQAAFKTLYDATVHCLFAIVMRMLRERSWAEDVLQDVYVNVWNTAPNYSAVKSQPMTWLMALARNKAIDALRSTRTERTRVTRPALGDDGEESDMPDVADERAGPLQRLVQSVESQRVHHCLEGLEPAQRQAIALAFYDGLTHAELAVHMRQPLGTVKAWVRRGLERLKLCLER